MKKLLLLVLALPFLGIAQEKGIRFEQGLSWKDILEKARAENKYIFVDCYATWCGPCKLMDKEVYPEDSVGNFMNSRFISVKVQMDSSIQDNEVVIKWYPSAKDIKLDYKVNAYPTFLFFSPVGELVHKRIGGMDMTSFIQLASNAINPGEQYYTLLHKYETGKLSYLSMPGLAKAAQSMDDKKISDQVAGDYIHNYVNKLPEDKLYSKEFFDFLGAFISFLSSKDKAFDLCFHYPARIDSIEFKGYSNQFVNIIINQEQITPELAKAKDGGPEPNWDHLTLTIREKYGANYVERNIVSAKVRWYAYKKDWRKYATYLVQKVETSELDKAGSTYLNNNAFEIFKYSDTKAELEKALSWIDRAFLISPNSAVMDTKANILYKLGRRDDGIALEEKAVARAPKDKEIQEAFEKMKKGLPTWPTEL